MRKDIRRFVQLVAETLPLAEPIYEFGALQVHDNPELEDLRSLFPGREYVGCDMRPGPGVDKVLNLHQIDLPDAVAGTVVLMDTLEHVEYPRQAISEVLRILKPGGTLIMSSVMDFPIHGYPNDYWRFTPEGFRSLLKPFDVSHVGYHGLREEMPNTIVGVGFKGHQPDLAEYEKRYLQWQHFCNCVHRKLAEA